MNMGSAWASRNYQIYLRTTNSGGLLLVGVVLGGTLMQYGQTESVMFSSGETIFGFLIGASLAYLNKGYSMEGVRDVIELAVI